MKAKTTKRLAGALLAMTLLFAVAAPVYATNVEAEAVTGCGAAIVSLGIVSGWGPDCTVSGCIQMTRYEMFDCANLCRSPNYSGYIQHCGRHGIIGQNGQVMGYC